MNTVFESRCGIRCDLCERREGVACTGCTHMVMPFWGGECTVKSCCEAKKISHCGECAVFPCEIEKNIGVEHGYDPAPRLEQCRKWKEQSRGAQNLNAYP